MRIVTHNGLFHADDVVAVSILLGIYPRAYVVRTRVPEVIRDADIAVDVGGGGFDHHQRGGNGARLNGSQYAAAGLVWKTFGHRVLEVWGVSEPHRDIIHQKLDKDFVQPIDDADNGVVRVEGGFSDLISGLNSLGDGGWDAAIQMATSVLRSKVLRQVELIEAREVLQTALDHQNDGVAVLSRFVPWTGLIKELDPEGQVKFICWMDQSSGTYRVQGVPRVTGQFGNLVDLPKEWGGLNGEDLDWVSGLDDTVFCHKGLFIAGARSLESVIKIARIALS